MSSGSSRVSVSRSAGAATPSSSLNGRALIGVPSRAARSGIRPWGGPAGSCWRQVLDGIDWLAQSPDLEMQLDLVGVRVAHFADLLPFGDLLAFLHQDLAIVRVGGKIGRVVLDDDELAVAAQSRARVDDLAGRARNHRLAGLAGDVDPLQARCIGVS